MKYLLSVLLFFQSVSFALAQSSVSITSALPESEAASVAVVEGAPQTDYIRYLEVDPASRSGEADRLQTAITSFLKDGTRVDLVGVIHLGDAAYYETLDRELARYDAVLYEMVGGPHRSDDTLSESAAVEGMDSIRQLQQMATSFFGLQYQLDGINYKAPNFVHADIAWDELSTLMAARNETFMTLLTRAMERSETANIAGLPSDEAEVEAIMKRVFSALLTGNSAELKRLVAPILSEAESFIAHLEGEDGSVLVSGRNEVVMAKLDELRAEKKGRTYAIFYGAGHMPDLEERLLTAGFTKGETRWLDAWTIPSNEVSSPEASPGGFLLRMLSENPEVMKGLEDLGSILENVGGALKRLDATKSIP